MWALRLDVVVGFLYEELRKAFLCSGAEYQRGAGYDGLELWVFLRGFEVRVVESVSSYGS